jgi:hypothetical protein
MCYRSASAFGSILEQQRREGRTWPDLKGKKKSDQTNLLIKPSRTRDAQRKLRLT